MWRNGNPVQQPSARERTRNWISWRDARRLQMPTRRDRLPPKSYINQIDEPYLLCPVFLCPSILCAACIWFSSISRSPLGDLRNTPALMAVATGSAAPIASNNDDHSPSMCCRAETLFFYTATVRELHFRPLVFMDMCSQGRRCQAFVIAPHKYGSNM